MVVRGSDANRGKFGGKLAKVMAASAVVVPGILANPLIVNENRSFAVEVPLPIPTEMYVGQILDLSKYGVDLVNGWVTTSSMYGGLYFPMDGFEPEFEPEYESSPQLVAYHAGTYTVYIYSLNMETDQYTKTAVDITVKKPDYNNDGKIDISDVVKHIHSQSKIVGDPIGFEPSEIRELLYSIDSLREEVNHAPELDLSSSHTTSAWLNPYPYFEGITSFYLDSYFTDQDGDFLYYTIHSSSNPAGVDVWIEDNTLIAAPGIDPGTNEVTVRAYDERGAYVEQVFNFNMNQAPVASETLSLIVADYNQTFNLNDYFTDPDGHDLSYYLVSTPYLGCGSSVYLSSTHNNNLVIDTYNFGSSSHHIIVQVSDDMGLSTEATFAVTFEAPPPPLD